MTLPDFFQHVKIGFNVPELSRLIETWMASASPAQALAARDAGIPHWPALAASKGGIVQLDIEHRAAGEGRYYAMAPFAIQSMPKALRSAITPVEEGHVVVEADWSASHWQILAFISEDAVLIEDLRSGDLYSKCFPAFERKVAKRGLNAVLNGGGVSTLTDAIGDAARAAEFKATADGLLKTRWTKAGAHIEVLKQQALANGWTKDAWKGAGIALMQAESARLVVALQTLLQHHPSVKVLCPMHDGIALSAPAEIADDVARILAYCMAFTSTEGSEEEATTHVGTWVTTAVNKSWGGSVEQLLGNDLRALGYGAILSLTDHHEAIVGRNMLPIDFKSAWKGYHHNTDQARLAKTVDSKTKQAKQWLAQCMRGKLSEEPVVLPHDAPNYNNVCRVLTGDGSLPELAFNVRTMQPVMGGDAATETAIRSTYLLALETRYGMINVPDSILYNAVVDTAKQNEFDPVFDYFESLNWDGTHRIDNWLSTYAGVDETHLSNTYSRKWLLSVVARAYDPGCQVDTMLVLEGDQGAKKTSMLRALAPVGSFETVAVDPSDKDMVLRASRYAIVEWGELAGAGKREQESLKDYLTRTVDRVRPPYGRTDVEIPRRAVFAATTNRDDFLADETGSRRYWPVHVGAIDAAAVARDRDQIWAEAVATYLYMCGDTPESINTPELQEVWDCKWWLTKAEEAMHEVAAATYTSEDPFADAIIRFASIRSEPFRIAEVMESMDIHTNQFNRISRTIASSLRRCGFKQTRVMVSGVRQSRWFNETLQAVAPAQSNVVPMTRTPSPNQSAQRPAAVPSQEA
jgi:predicted P-loop ATPase